MINAPVSQRDWNSHPPLIHPPYTSTVLRGPTKPLIPLAHGLAESTGPVFGHESVQALDSDMTRNARRNGEPADDRMAGPDQRGEREQQDRIVPCRLPEGLVHGRDVVGQTAFLKRPLRGTYRGSCIWQTWAGHRPRRRPSQPRGRAGEAQCE
jgi:hypothetical protein